MLSGQARAIARPKGGPPPFGGPATRQAVPLLTGVDRTETSSEQAMVAKPR